jgi:ubiquitin C-terminal hydrolase
MNCNNIVKIQKENNYIYNYFDIDEKYFSKKLNLNFNTIDDYKCDKCKKTTKLIILNGLNSVSDVFVMSFNKYTEKKNIDFPETIELTDKNIKYGLIGVIDHFGNLDSGHYISQVKRKDKYYLIDDMSVNDIDSFKISKNNFILFYQKI